jgi:DNA-binding PadR family transcriptional regulator
MSTETSKTAAAIPNSEVNSTTKNEKTYTLTSKGKEAILAIIAKKPFNSVVSIIGLLEKDSLSEEEANLLINFIGNYPYVEVIDFFTNLTENITMHEK